MKNQNQTNRKRGAAVVLQRLVSHFRDNCCWQQWAVIGIGMAVLAPISIGGSIGILLGGLILLFILGPLLNR